jgi:uncharacterized protein (DUF305 family)
MKRNIIIGIIVVVLAAGGIAWYLITEKQMREQVQQETSKNTSSEASSQPKDDNKFATLKGEEFDKAYVADMLAHHEGAVNMSEMAGAAAQRQEIRDLAQTIVDTQSQEISQMRTWQQEWGYEVTMGGHGSHGGSANDMSMNMMNMGDELNGLSGTEFDKKFLELMIEHHQQAIDMSKYANTNASHQEIKDLAKAVISAQQSEITKMKQWQKDWGFTS